MSVRPAAVSVSVSPFVIRRPGGGFPSGSSANGNPGSFNAVIRVVSHARAPPRMSYPAANVKLMFDFRAPGQFPVDMSPGRAVPADPGPAGLPQEPPEPPPDLGSVPLE